MEEFGYELKVPKDRVAVIIGTKGSVKKTLQDVAGVKMHIDSDEGEVTLEGDDSIKLYQARQVIKAIARGFNPDIAQLLLKQDYALETMKLTDYTTPNGVQRLKGRVIGVKGKSRENLEKLTETFISVYGKTISIVGELQRVTIAKRAIEKLLTGQMHATVWKFLEKMRREMRRQELQ